MVEIQFTFTFNTWSFNGCLKIGSAFITAILFLVNLHVHL
jgi:hypothetical protein